MVTRSLPRAVAPGSGCYIRAAENTALKIQAARGERKLK
jgi:hypothetical protein